MCRQLAGRTLLICRPEPGCSASIDRVMQMGGRAIRCPVLEIVPPLRTDPLHTALQTIDRRDAVVITSGNAIRMLPPSLLADSLPWPPLFAVGKKTAATLTRYGLSPHLPENPFDADTLTDHLLQWLPEKDLERANILFFSAEKGRRVLAERLSKAGHSVETVIAYRTVMVERLTEEAVSALSEGNVDGIPFYSGRTVEALVAACKKEESTVWSGVRTARRIAISQRVAQVMAQAGIPADGVATKPDDQEMLQELSMA
ncbi:MAG: uroporphyrinogen-III synthase [Magnetococcales bacterium]|nr:uroporphyrinogen-III synthase [Magnetococcales bacterium]